MRGRIEISIQVAALIFAAMAPGLAAAQGGQTVSLGDQLSAQYTMVKMGADSSGPAVVEPGTILVIQKGGILGVPYSDVSIVPTKYQDGKMQTPNSLMLKGIGHAFSHFGSSKQQTTHLFQVGEKVYPSRVEVNQAADKVTLGIVACDSCNNTNPPTFFKADVVFQFTRGYLSAASPPQVMDVIAQVFTIDDSGGGDQGGGDQGNQAQGGPQGGPPGGPPPPPQPPPQPQTIQLGQTTDQVVAAIGQPDKIVNLGAKQIYVYKDIKVTFLKGKVSDVQ
jgi:hypothetical protein